MKFSTQKTVGVPSQHLFAAFRDFEEFEQLLMERGAEVRRTGDGDGTGLGMSWDVVFTYRGKRRTACAVVSALSHGENIMIDMTNADMDGQFDVVVEKVTAHKSRVKVGLKVIPKTISTRLLIQSLKLAKSQMTKNFANRIRKYCDKIERTHNTAP